MVEDDPILIENDSMKSVVKRKESQTRRAPRVFIGQGRFSEARAQF